MNEKEFNKMEVPAYIAKANFSTRLDCMQAHFNYLSEHDTKTLKAATVRKIATGYRFTYGSGKLAANRANIKVN